MKEMIEKENHPQLPLPPGTARVEAIFVDSVISGKGYQKIFKINEVKGYGPSTSPIGTETRMTLSLNKNLLKDPKKAMFIRNQKYDLTIRSVYTAMKREKKWQIVKINEIQQEEAKNER